jgi:chaperonin GroES
MKLVPLGDNVVIRRVDSEDVTAGGIVLPDSAQQQQSEGSVLSVGDGMLLPDGSRAEPQVSKGDRVLFSSFAGNPILVDDQELLVMRESDILAILE